MPRHNEFHIPSLDGIRGLAALIVFVSHAGLRALVPGGFGVTVFFFLSGFLITTLLRIEFERTRTISFRNFYLRRIYRILPPMYIVLIVVMSIALAGWLPHHMNAEAVLAQFAHLTNYYYVFGEKSGFVPSTSVMWSLAVEEHFYLLFPVAIVFLFRRFPMRRIAVILLVACGIVLAWRCYVMLVLELGQPYTYHATDTRLDSLLYGCILAVWCNPVLDAQRIRLRPRTAGVLFAIATGVLLFCFVHRDPLFRETLRYSLQGMALFVVFLCAVRYHELPVFSWLDSRPMRALGLISYTFYLTHLPCLALIDTHTSLDGLPRGIAGFIATTAVSSAMYLLVERHLAALRKKLHREGVKPAAGRAADSLTRPAT